MVSIVTGSGSGLFNSSRDLLGAAGEFGQAQAGRAGERVTVNAANGNLVIQNRDEYLLGVGPDVGLLRTYNSSGAWDGDNNDGWRIGYYRRVFGFDANAGVVKRIDADGHETAFYLNAAAGKYFTYPSQAGATYTVRSDKETLYSIAQAVWGDRSMWYLIAEANGLQANAALKAGQLLLIPNKVANIHNNSQTWRPYNPGEAIGATDPVLPYYEPSGGDMFADPNALQDDPVTLLARALSQTSYMPEDNPASWGSGGDRSGDYAFISQWDSYHSTMWQWAGGVVSSNTDMSRLPQPVSPNNAAYGRGLDDVMRTAALTQALEAEKSRRRSAPASGPAQLSPAPNQAGQSDAKELDAEIRRLLARSIASSNPGWDDAATAATVSWTIDRAPSVFELTASQAAARSAVLAA